MPGLLLVRFLRPLSNPSCGSGTVYVAFVVDTFSRRIVGWSAATNKQTPLVLSALEMGLWQRDRARNPVSAS